MPNRFFSGSDKHSYGFQGQLVDDEIKGENNSVNFKYRMHDPRIGRFFAVDPLTHSYPHYTPYSFSGNKVIAFVELEGMEEIEYYKSDSYDGKTGLQVAETFSGNTLKSMSNAFIGLWNDGVKLVDDPFGEVVTRSGTAIKDAGVSLTDDAIKLAHDPVGEIKRTAEAVGELLSDPSTYENGLGAIIGGGLIKYSKTPASAPKVMNPTAPKKAPASNQQHVVDGSGKNSSLAKKLNTDLKYQEKSSIFNPNGGLQASAINKSKPILNGTKLGTKTQNILLKQGGKISDWNKMSYNTGGKSGIDVHFYYNSKTKQAYYGADYKSKMGSEYNKTSKPKE